VRPARSWQLSRANEADVDVGIASSNCGRFKQPLRSASDQERGKQSGHCSLHRQGVQGEPYNPLVDHSQGESSKSLP